MPIGKQSNRLSRKLLRKLLMLAVLGGAPSVSLFSQEAGSEAPQEGESSCVVCHQALGGEFEAAVEGMKNDIHGKRGLSCVDCHGGDPSPELADDMVTAMDPQRGFIGVPSRMEIPGFCARCHSDPQFMRQFNPRIDTDQYDRYLTSVHGQRLKEGDTKVATCVDCHSVHGIQQVGDARSPVYPTNIPNTCARCHSDPEYMADYGIPTDQVEQYSQSVHGTALLKRGDLAAPACNDCHGNHGASPPGAPSIAYVCGQCHLNNSELFLASPHRSAFAEMYLPECETCHGNHLIEHPTDELLSRDGVCVECHAEDSKGDVTAAAMYGEINALKFRLEEAEQVMSEAERAGMPVSELEFQLSEAHDSLIKARTQVHSLSVSRVSEITGEGKSLAEQVLAAGRDLLAEVQYRRKGLAVSLIFILILAAGIYLKIKEVDRQAGMS